MNDELSMVNENISQLKKGYKQTEVEVIPEDWEVRYIKDISTSYSGGTPNTSNINFYGNEIPFIASGELNQKRIRKTSKGITNQGLNNSSAKIVEKGTLLIAMYGATAGVTAITEIKGAINQAVLAILTKAVDSDYLFNWFLLNKEKIISIYTQGGQPNLSGGLIKQIKIPLPPTRAEQTAIATALSDMDSLIEGLEKLIAKKRNIKQGAMQKLLSPYLMVNGELLMVNGKPKMKDGWEVKTLGEIAEIKMGQSPKSEFYNNLNIGLPLIQGNADIKDRKTIIRNFTSQITKKCKVGDIIMSVRAPVGEIAEAVFDACIGRGVCAITYSNKFLFHYLIYIEPQWAKHSTGSTFDSVNSDTVNNLPIPLPSTLEEQTRIANILSDIDNEIEKLENQLSKYKQLKTGMMQELLTGKKRLV